MESLCGRVHFNTGDVRANLECLAAEVSQARHFPAPFFGGITNPYIQVYAGWVFLGTAIYSSKLRCVPSNACGIYGC